jgi:PKD repeat protein
MRSIGTLAVVTGMLLLGSACSDDAGTPPPENTAPVAKFDVPPCTIDVPCPFASTSTDDAEVTGWSWDFDGDGTADATTSSTSFKYTSAGSFDISLTVRDAEGLTNTKTSTITIAPAPPVNTPPTAGFTHTCNAVACTFISTSTDVGPGTIVTYAWTFGDGAAAQVKDPSHSYSVTAATTFTVTLTVTDNEGANDVETQAITVDPVPPVNQAPIARFTYSCVAAVCTFVNTSYDHGGRITANAWTFGDGGTATETSPTHSYTVTAATEFTVTLTVTDNEGATGVTSQKFILDPTAANVPPTASFTPWCYGEGCMFFSHSTDVAPGTIVSYAWTFGDGGTEDWSAPSHVYTITARTTFTVTLTVTDNEGATAVATQTVTVTPLPPAVQGCTTSGKVVDCVLDIPARSTLKLKLLGIDCDPRRLTGSRITTPPPVGDQVFLSVCWRTAGEELGIFGGKLDELIVYQTGTQARIWFTQGDAAANVPAPAPSQGQVTGNFPDWTINFEDGDHAGEPGEPDFTDVVLGVHATLR